jgi:predicted HTH transcriptional regulator
MENPSITQKELSQILKINESVVRKPIENQKEKTLQTYWQ